MTATETAPTTRFWTAAELRCLPHDERDAVLAIAARYAEREYALGSELTASEAFREEDLHGCSSNTQPR